MLQLNAHTLPSKAFIPIGGLLLSLLLPQDAVLCVCLWMSLERHQV
jgi:hypothetical protein